MSSKKRPRTASQGGARSAPLSVHRESDSAKRRFLLILAGLACVAAAAWYFSNPAQDQAAASLDRALAAIDRSDWKTAGVELELLHRLRPEDVTIMQRAAEVAQHCGDAAAAIDWLARIPPSHSVEYVESRYRAAQIGMESGRAAKAETLLESILARHASFSPARRLLTRLDLILLRETSLRRQILELDRSGELTLNDLFLLCSGARAEWESDDHVNWLEGCLDQDPENAVVRAALAAYLIRRNRRPEARGLLEKSLPDRPDSWRIGLVRAEDAIDAGNWDSAAGLLAGLRADAAVEPRVWLARGRVAMEQSRFRAAQAAFDVAAALDPYDPSSAYGAARAADHLQDPAASLLLFQRAHQLQRLLTMIGPLLQAGAADPEQTGGLAGILEELDFRREAAVCHRDIIQRTPAPAADLVRHSQSALARLEPGSSPGSKSGNLAFGSRNPQSAIDEYGRLEDHDLTGVLTASRSRGTHAAHSREGISHEVVSRNAELPAGAGIRLRDVAVQTGLKFEYDTGNSRYRWLMETLGGGVAVLDYDRDGRPDVFFSQGCPLPVRPSPGRPAGKLFRNRDGKSFEEATQSANIAQQGYGQGVAAGDFDNDGFSDLLICRYGSVSFYRNRGDGTFEDATGAVGLNDAGWSSSAAFGDLDRDGDLDLYIVHYVHAPYESLRPCGTEEKHEACRPLSYPDEQDTVWENLGDGRYSVQTNVAGIKAADGKGLGVIIADFDGDAWPDIFVGNDTTANFLFQNKGSTSGKQASPFFFEEAGLRAGVALDRDGRAQACMGIACGDADGDGLFDLFVTNFQDETNTFYQNQGGLSFVDRTPQFDLADSSRQVMGWGCQFADLDGDGDLDLFVSNGHLHDIAQKPLLYQNLAVNGRFENVSDAGGDYFHLPRLGRSVATTDWNGDRRPDLVVTYQSGNVSLLENQTRGGNRLAIRFVGTRSNRDAEGTIVTVRHGTVRSVHRVSSGGGYFAANENTLLLGTGDAAGVDRLEVRWPSGAQSEIRGLAAGHGYVLVEGNERPTLAVEGSGLTHEFAR